MRLWVRSSVIMHVLARVIVIGCRIPSIVIVFAALDSWECFRASGSGADIHPIVVPSIFRVDSELGHWRSEVDGSRPDAAAVDCLGSGAVPH